MTINENILQFQLNNGVFDDASFSGTKGIAQLAVNEGFDKLTQKQKGILSSYLNVKCSGYKDPGDHYYDCDVKLFEQELLDALNQSIGENSLLCNDCLNQVSYFRHQWSRIEKE